MAIEGAKLRPSPLDSGERATDSAALSLAEYDGYIELRAGDDVVRVPWHVLPRRAADLQLDGAPARTPDGEVRAALRNLGAGTAQNTAFALLAESPARPGGRGPEGDLQAVGVRTTDQDRRVCSSGFAWEFAFNTVARQSLLLRARLSVGLDVDRDGTEDFSVFNGNASLLDGGVGTDARQRSLVSDLERRDPMTGAAPLTSMFFAEHATQTANTVLRVCGEQLGLTAADRGTRLVDATFRARTTSSSAVDVIPGLTIVPGADGVRASVDDVPGGTRGTLSFRRTPQPTGASAPRGVLVFSNSARAGSTGGASEASEAQIVPLR
jgi:hypothetical protein